MVSLKKQYAASRVQNTLMVNVNRSREELPWPAEFGAKRILEKTLQGSPLARERRCVSCAVEALKILSLSSRPRQRSTRSISPTKSFCMGFYTSLRTAEECVRSASTGKLTRGARDIARIQKRWPTWREDWRTQGFIWST